MTIGEIVNKYTCWQWQGTGLELVKQSNIIRLQFLFIYFWMDRLYCTVLFLCLFSSFDNGDLQKDKSWRWQHASTFSLCLLPCPSDKYTKIVILSLKLWRERASENKHQWLVQSNHYHCFNLMFYGMTYQFCWCKIRSLNTALLFFLLFLGWPNYLIEYLYYLMLTTDLDDVLHQIGRLAVPDSHLINSNFSFI